MTARMLVNENNCLRASCSKGPRPNVAKIKRRNTIPSTRPIVETVSFLGAFSWRCCLYVFFTAVIVMHPGVSCAQESNGSSWSVPGPVESPSTGGRIGFYQSANTNLSSFSNGDQIGQGNSNRDWQSSVPPNTSGFPFARGQEITSSSGGQPDMFAPNAADHPVSDSVTPPQVGASSRAPDVSIPLRHPNAKGSAHTSQPKSPTAFGSATVPWMTTISALAIVLGVLFLFYWGMKRLGPKTNQTLPTEAVELLGSTALSPRQRLCLIRVGRKLVLVAMSADGVEPLTEIDDPVEVDRLVGICASQRSGSATHVFHQVFSQYIHNATATG